MKIYYQCTKCQYIQARDRPRSHMRAAAACAAPYVREDGTAYSCGGALRYVSHEVERPT